jgi:hypothetical protein
MTDEWYEKLYAKAGIDMFEAKVQRLLAEFNFLAGTKHDKDTANSKPDEAQTEHERDGDR